MDGYVSTVQSLKAAMDEYAKSAVVSYDACEKAGNKDCDESFAKNLQPAKKGKAQAMRLREVIKSFYACQRNSSDPSVCTKQVKAQLRDIASAAPRVTGATLPKTAMEMQAVAAPNGPSASSIISQNELAPQGVVNPSSNSFDPAKVYAQLPRINPLASIPLRDMVGRTMMDSVKNPFRHDIRPPVFPPLKMREGLPVMSKRIQEIEALKRQQAALKSGIGYSANSNPYCSSNLS